MSMSSWAKYEGSARKSNHVGAGIHLVLAPAENGRCEFGIARVVVEFNSDARSTRPDHDLSLGDGCGFNVAKAGLAAQRAFRLTVFVVTAEAGHLAFLIYIEPK